MRALVDARTENPNVDPQDSRQHGLPHDSVQVMYQNWYFAKGKNGR